jgi:hypothetical protein
MKKLKLVLDDVAVETFEMTSSDLRMNGTVQGQQSYMSAEIACPTATCHEGCTANCPTYPPVTWNQTCPATCDWGYGCESGYPNCPL